MQLLCSELLRNSNAALHTLNVTQSIRSLDHWKAICAALHRNTSLHKYTGHVQQSARTTVRSRCQSTRRPVASEQTLVSTGY